MKVKDLKKILLEIGEQCDEYPVRIWLEKVSENQGGGNRYSELDEHNWEIAGLTEDKSFLSINESDIVIL